MKKILFILLVAAYNLTLLPANQRPTTLETHITHPFIRSLVQHYAGNNGTIKIINAQSADTQTGRVSPIVLTKKQATPAQQKQPNA